MNVLTAPTPVRNFEYFNRYSTSILLDWIKYCKKDIRQALKDPSVNIKGLKSDLKYMKEVVDSRKGSK